jgi:hypothetical protein
MSYGVFQEYYSDDWTLQGSQHITGSKTTGFLIFILPGILRTLMHPL